jgi:integrase
MKRLNSNKVGEVWVYQRQPKGNWYYALTLSNGKRVEKSFGTSNLGRATEMAKNVNNDLTSKSEGESIDLPESLAEAFGQYIQHLKSEGCVRKTIVRYTGIYANFTAFATSKNVKTIHGLSQRLLNLFRQKRESEVFDTTRHFETERISEFGSYLVSEHLIDKNPFDISKLRKPQKIPWPWFTYSQVETILDLASDKDKKIFEVLAYTGMRIGELKRLSWSHIDFKRNILLVESTPDNPTKGKRSREIPMHDKVLEVLSKIEPKVGLVFNSGKSYKHPNGDGPLNERRLLERVKKICLKLEIEGCVHSFRKFFCSFMANQGIPPLTLMSWTGHSDIKILINSYYKLNEEDSVNFMKKVCRSEDEVSNTERHSRDNSRDTEDFQNKK